MKKVLFLISLVVFGFAADVNEKTECEIRLTDVVYMRVYFDSHAECLTWMSSVLTLMEINKELSDDFKKFGKQVDNLSKEYRAFIGEE